MESIKIGTKTYQLVANGYQLGERNGRVIFLPGEDSFYSAPYEYSRGSSKSCSGAFVDDPDLQKTIFICYPYGDYQDGNVIYVKKRVNALGAVVTYAYATSGRFRFD